MGKEAERQLAKRVQAGAKVDPKKAYRAPVLTEFGTIIELTGSALAGFIDAGPNSSTGA